MFNLEARIDPRFLLGLNLLVRLHLALRHGKSHLDPTRMIEQEQRVGRQMKLRRKASLHLLINEVGKLQTRYAVEFFFVLYLVLQTEPPLHQPK